MKKTLSILLLGSALLVGSNLEAWHGGHHHHHGGHRHHRGGWRRGGGWWGPALAGSMMAGAIAASAAREPVVIEYIDDPYEWYWSRYPRASWDAYISWLELNRARFRRPWRYYYGPRFHRRWRRRW